MPHSQKQLEFGEKEPDSGVWWIKYRVASKLKREKVGRGSDARLALASGKGSH